MRKSCLLLLLAVACLLFVEREVKACSCGQTPTVLDSYDGADHVVITRVVAVEKTENAAPKGRMSDGTNYVDGVKSTRMVIERVFKGGLKVGDEMTFAQGGGADCIWTFNEDNIGHKYLFYLKRFGDETMWIAGACGRSGNIEYANDDLLYLNNLKKTRGRTRISGTINFEGADDPGVAGRKIRIVGASKSYEVKTDENGVYEIYDVPAGKYSIEPEMPPGWKVANFWLEHSPSFAGDAEVKSPKKIPIVLKDKKHAGLDIRFEVDNAIRGTIYDTTGKQMNGVCLKLVPADGTKGAYLADCTEKNGTFEIDEIPPGSYVLVVNDDGKITSSEPFNTFYYPNVYKREDATVFHISLGDFVENVQVHVPQMEETITVEGLLLYSDGKPAPDEAVEFKSVKSGSNELSEARVKTDAKGRFSLKILKGLEGRLYGQMYTFSGEFENCPKLESIIKKSANSSVDIETPAIKILAENNLQGLELKFPFPACKKAKID